LPAEGVQFDVVLLSHDHHADNLDRTGREVLAKAKRVFTTKAGAERLGGNAVGLAPWESAVVASPTEGVVKITGTPARHGPANLDRGPVTGFVLQSEENEEAALYISGDTVWYEGVAEIKNHFRIACGVLFMGAARVPEVGPSHLTMSAQEAVQFATLFPGTAIIPLHYEGWCHFSESRQEIEDAFKVAKMDGRLRWMQAGEPTEIEARNG